MLMKEMKCSTKSSCIISGQFLRSFYGFFFKSDNIHETYWIGILNSLSSIYSIEIFSLQTRGPWATSLTWETSMNTFSQSYDYITTLICRRKKLSSSFWLFVKSWFSFTQGCFVQSLIEIGPMVLVKNIFKLW